VPKCVFIFGIMTKKNNNDMIVLQVPAYPPSERGAYHGRALSTQINTLFSNWLSNSDHEIRSVLHFARQCWPHIQKFSPDAAEELTSLAEGAGMDLMKVVALNCYDELGLVGAIQPETEGKGRPCAARSKGAHCTGVAGRLAQGQNWDCPLYYKPVLLLQVVTPVSFHRCHGLKSVKSIQTSVTRQSDEMVEEVHLTFPGIIGGPFMTRTLSCLWMSVIPKKFAPGVPNPVLLREAAATAGDAQAAVEIWRKAPRPGGSCFVVSSLSQSKHIETIQFEANTWQVCVKKQDICSHANHFLSPKLRHCDQLKSDPWTLRRYERMDALVAERRNDGQELDVAWVQRVLGDLDGLEEGVSICEHAAYTGGMWDTLASIVFDLKLGLCWFHDGHPNIGRWQGVGITLRSRGCKAQAPLKARL